jgi:tetratricopeptide (TPR) repeat protein
MYQRLGNMQDLDEALHCVQDAVDLTPKSHPDRPKYTQGLSLSLRHRYIRLGDFRDLQLALELCRGNIALTPAGHPDLPSRLKSLAVTLQDMYQRLWNMQDLDEGLLYIQKAVDLAPEGHPERPGCLQTLANVLKDRYQSYDDPADLSIALQAIQEAVNTSPDGHPDLSGHLQSLAVLAGHKYHRSGHIQDLETAFASFSNSFMICTTCPRLAWKAALDWVLLAKKHRFSEVLTAYSAAFNLLPEILWIGSSVAVCEDAREDINIIKVTSDAVMACLAVSNLQLAVEFLEQGQMTTARQLQQLKIDFDGLSMPHDLKVKLQQLSFELYSGGPSDTRLIAAKRNKLLREIRKLPGFDLFLCPRQYNTLCQVSQNGPVIILNSHSDHCDSLVLLHTGSDPLHISLPVTLRELQALRNFLDHELGQGHLRLVGKAENSSRTPPLEDMLTWLWKHVVVHIYNSLESVSLSHQPLCFVN